MEEGVVILNVLKGKFGIHLTTIALNASIPTASFALLHLLLMFVRPVMMDMFYMARHVEFVLLHIA